MMKNIKLIALILLLNTISVTAYAQTDCTDKLLDFTSNLNADSLKVDLNLILSIKDYEDIPFYDEIQFTSSPKNPQYFLIKKVKPEASLGYKIFDWDNTEIKTETIEQKIKGESLITLKKHQSGNYKMVLYSKNPDGSCISLTKLKRKTSDSISLPTSNLNQTSDLKALTLLKEYNVEIETNDLPFIKEYSYVFTKGTDYYFYWENNENLKLKVTNSKREEQEINFSEEGNSLGKTTCETTGIYYIIIYAKEALAQNSTLKLFYDEKSRKRN